MDGDDLVIGYLAGETTDEPLDESVAADLDSLNELLADPSMWDEPGDDLRERVLVAVADAVAMAPTRSSTPPAGSPPPSPTLAPAGPQVVGGSGTAGRRRRWTTWVGPALVGAAAAGLIAVAVARTSNDESERAVDGTISLSGTELLPDVSGTANVTEESSGVWIQLNLPGLPRRDGNDFYQAWLRSEDGNGLVPIGSFHDADHVSLWAGVPISDFPILTVTKETVAGPKSPDQGSSGEVVARGHYSEP